MKNYLHEIGELVLSERMQMLVDDINELIVKTRRVFQFASSSLKIGNILYRIKKKQMEHESRGAGYVAREMKHGET